MAKAIDRNAQGRADRERRRQERRNAPADLKVGADLTAGERKARERSRDALEHRDPRGSALSETYRKMGAAGKAMGRSAAASRGSRFDGGDVGGFERTAKRAGPQIGDKRLATAAGMDAGTRSMRAGGRTAWNANDFNAASKARAAVMGQQSALAAKQSVADLRAAAKRAGIKGASKMKKADLVAALASRQPKTRAQMVAGRKNGPVPVRTARLVSAIMGRAGILAASAAGGSGATGSNADGGK